MDDFFWRRSVDRLNRIEHRLDSAFELMRSDFDANMLALAGLRDAVNQSIMATGQARIRALEEAQAETARVIDAAFREEEAIMTRQFDSMRNGFRQLFVDLREEMLAGDRSLQDKMDRLQPPGASE